MILYRQQLGNELRAQRHRQGRRLVDVATAAYVSVSYLSEVERGRKEVSSELLAAICTALNVAPGFPLHASPGATLPKGSPPQ